MEEKSLITKENISIFQKIKLFFQNFFYKKSKKDNIMISETKRENINNDIIENLKIKQKKLELQQKYESGYILEGDLTDVQKEELRLLYKEQIESLEERKYKNEKILKDLKNKIMIIRGISKIQ